MRYLILSDIHGNRHGLEAVLSQAEGQYDRILCLGDVVGYGAHPNKCCEILRKRRAACLLGNHDVAALGWLSTEWFNDVAATSAEWTRKTLTKENRVWLCSLSGLPQEVMNTESPFQATHGSLREPYYEEYILNAIDAFENIALTKHDLCFFGHTHRAVAYRTSYPFDENADVTTIPLDKSGLISLEAGFSYLVNPGSCGQPRDGNPQARYAILDEAARTVEIKGAGYDIEAARRAILEAGLSSVSGDRLREAW